MKVIPTSHDQEPGAAASKRELTLTRRSIFKGIGVLVGTLATGSPLVSLAPSTAWAVEFKALSRAEGDTLLQTGRVLFPHIKLPDITYALLMKDLDARAAQDAQAATQLHEGIAVLDKLAGGSFVKIDAKRRLITVKAVGGKPFFNTVRDQCMTSLYDNEVVPATFGYSGSAWEKGGYIIRGFQDLKWLPTPSMRASPPLFLG